MSDLNLVTQNNKYGVFGEEEYLWLEALAEDEEEDDIDFDVDFDFDDESSSGTPEISSVNTKKRRVRDRRRIYAPRVIKRDIRRQYPAMFANVYNSLDTSIIASFFQTFAIPHMRVRKTNHLHFTTNPSFQSSFPHDVISNVEGGGGLLWMVMFFTVMKSLCPDNVMRIVSSQLLTRSDTSKTLLTMKLRVDFTRFHDVNPMLFTEGMFAEASKAMHGHGHGHGHGYGHGHGHGHGHTQTDDHIHRLAMSPTGYFKDKVGSDIPLLKTPENIAFTSIFRIYIDEYKRIEMMESSEAELVM